MIKKPNFENRYILLSTGEIVDLLDPLVFDTDIETTVKKKCCGNITLIQCANSVTKLFSEVLAFNIISGESAHFGPTNWDKLFLVHNQYYFFLAFTSVENDKRHLAAKSTDGVFWFLNVNDA